MREGTKVGHLLIYQRRKVKDPWAFSLVIEMRGRGTKVSASGQMFADWLPHSTHKLILHMIPIRTKSGEEVVRELARLAARYGRPMIAEDLDQVRTEVSGKLKELRES